MIIDINKITLHSLSDYTNNKIRRCPICGKEFKITRSDKMACSPKCISRINYRNRKGVSYVGR